MNNKVAILYISLGRYTIFWDDFYNSSEKYFLNGISKTYFVFTDNETISFEKNSNVIKIPQNKLGWPYDTMLRFKMFLTQEEQLKKFDYIFFFNANMMFVDYVRDEILPTSNNDGLVMGIHSGFYNKKNDAFCYERNEKSTSYIPYGEGKVYIQGCLNGGTSSAYLNLCEWCNAALNEDLANNIIPLWHDESILNKYILDKNPLLLPCNYLYPELSNLPDFSDNKKIIQRDKRLPKYGGIKWLRGETDIKCTKFNQEEKDDKKNKKLMEQIRLKLQARINNENS